MAAPTLDGKVQVNSAGGFPLTAVLTTALTDDIIIAIVDVHSNNASVAVTGVTVDGHAMALRKSTQVNSQYGIPLIQTIWWYHSAVALVAKNVVATLTNFSGNSYTDLTAFGVNGCDLTTPFDPNSSLPAVTHSTASSTRTTHNTTFSTTNANTFAFAVRTSDTYDGGGASAPVDSGWTTLEFDNAFTTYKLSFSESQAFTSVQTSVTLNVAASVTAADGDISTIDALQAPIPALTGTMAVTEAPDTMSAAAGHLSPIGTMALSEAKDTMSAAGTVPLGPPTFVNAGTGSSQPFGSSITLNLPASLVVGNVLIGVVFGGGNGTGFTWPAGWHQIDDIDITNFEGSYAYYFVTGSDTNPNVSWAGNAGATGFILQYKNTTLGNPIGAFQKNHSNSSTVTGGSLTTTKAKSLVVDIEYVQGNTESAPSGYTAETNFNIGAERSYVADVYEVTSGSVTPSISNTLSGAALWTQFQFEILAFVPPPTGTWVSTEVKDAANFVGGTPTGTWGSTEAADSFASAGIVPPPPLGLDGHATGGALGAPVNSANVTLTTTKVHDVIVLAITAGGFWNRGIVTSVTDTAGLVWKKRQQRQFNGGQIDLEVWWAHAPAILTGDVITVHTDATGFISIEAFGVSGANYTAPWDTHTGAGMFYDYFEVNPFGTYPVEIPVYTDAVRTFTFGVFSSGSTVPIGTVTPSPMFTFLDQISKTEPVSGTVGTVAVAYGVINTQQSGAAKLNIPNAFNGEYAMHLDSIVGIGESGTTDAIRWFFDGMGARSVVALSSGVTSNPFDMTTYHSNSVLCCAVLMQASGTLGIPTVDHISDSRGGTWVRRSHVKDTTGVLALEIWYCQASTLYDPTTTGGGAVTVFTANMGDGDIVGMVGWAVNGPSVFLRGELWDGDPSLPATNFKDNTASYQTAGPFNTINQNVLVVSIAANIETAGNLTGFNTPPYLFLHAPAELVSSTPAFNIAVEFKFSAPVVTGGTAEFDVSPQPNHWLMIADAMPVGPPSPPQGAWISVEVKDFTGNNGLFGAIGLTSAGWVGYVPAHAAMAAIETKDRATNSGAFSPLFDGSGFVGYVPARATMATTESKDAASGRAWVLGGPVVGRMASIEAKDRFGWSNRATVTGTFGAIETSDRASANAFLIPTAPPFVVNINRRRLMIVT